MSEFQPAVDLVLKHEGGLVDNPDDPGGITNYGISLSYLQSLLQQQPDLLSQFSLDGQPTIDAYDIENMTKETAESVYYNQWWKLYQYGDINAQILANKVLDLSVNMGPYNAAKLLQQACCVLSPGCLVVDGVLGPDSYACINHLTQSQPNILLTQFCDQAANYYRYLVSINPSLSQFLQGWLNRVYGN